MTEPKAIVSIVRLALLIVTITSFWTPGQRALAIRGQTLSITIESRGITIESPGLLSGNLIHVPIHSITHVRLPIGIQGKETPDLVQVPIKVCSNAVSTPQT